jgi:CTP:molybdopterin cytidylyltransferase MocA
MTSVIGVVLAAGRGRRMGGPKALLAWGADRMPLAAAHADAWSFCDRVLIVTRSDIASALRRAAPLLEAEVVISHADDELGPAGSLAAAAEIVEGEPLMLVTPVDCPPVAEPTTRALLAAMDAPHVAAARPRHGDRRGHPVVLDPEVWRRYREVARPLRDVLRELGERVTEVAVDDPGVLRDIDRPSDLDEAPRFVGPGGRERNGNGF